MRAGAKTALAAALGLVVAAPAMEGAVAQNAAEDAARSEPERAVAGPAIAGDPERGAALFKRCVSCHAVGENPGRKFGPHLNGLFGRRAAGLESYGAYSPAMKRAGADGLVWTAEQLDRFIERPQALVTKTKMPFFGMPEAQDRHDVIAFLRQYSASPRDIPESAPTAPPSDPDVSPEILAIVGDPEYGAYLAGECLTCHQESGAGGGVPAITGWPAEQFVVVLHAYKSKARPHPVMRMIAGGLSDEEIAALAAYFETLGPN